MINWIHTRLTRDALRPYIMVVLAPLAPLVVAWINARFGLALDEEQQQRLLEHAVDFAVLAITAGFVKVSGNKRVNPANAATTPLAVAGKEINEDEKRLQRVTKDYAARKAVE